MNVSDTLCYAVIQHMYGLGVFFKMFLCTLNTCRPYLDTYCDVI